MEMFTIVCLVAFAITFVFLALVSFATRGEDVRVMSVYIPHMLRADDNDTLVSDIRLAAALHNWRSRLASSKVVE